MASPHPRPPKRRLRVYSFDPSLARQLDTAEVSELTLTIPWEYDAAAARDLPQPGPIGEYVEVVDVDPASGAAYAPIDLNHEYLLATDGLRPSVGNPQFHQQMVYAVAMNTIANFERALGRRVLWSPRRIRNARGQVIEDRFVPRLRIYPHALREANAYYSPAKKALLFGYFPADPVETGIALPGGLVFTCLSHDVVVHETTHAILDGMHRRFLEPSNPDVLAFHEAFADIVALFQHFSHPDVLCDQIRRTRGDLERQSLLAQLAQEFGQAIGRYGALRDALGGRDPETGEWGPSRPDPDALERTFEPHARGSILVAAVFDAFLTIYRSRIRDLLRIASGGTGVLPRGEIHPDLVNRLADEAAKSAGHVLNMCIRALDYAPPVDITFGDYLRALITADRDMVPIDARDYRLAMIEAFRRRGIYPEGVRSMSEESLVWEPPAAALRDDLQSILGGLKGVFDWESKPTREALWDRERRNRGRLRTGLRRNPPRSLLRSVGLTLAKDAPGSVFRAWDGLPALEVHSVRPALRVGPSGQTVTDVVVELTQRRRGYFDRERQGKVDRGAPPGAADFVFRGGATLLIDRESSDIRYAVWKGITSNSRLRRQREYWRPLESPGARLAGRAIAARASLRTTYFGEELLRAFTFPDAGSASGAALDPEPLAILHRGEPGEGGV